MTKRSLKGTPIVSRSSLTRDAYSSIWLADTTPNSAKDNPLALTVLQDTIATNIKAILDGGFISISDSTNDVIAFAPSSVIQVAGSIHTVLEVFYIYVNGNIFKVNTGSATLTDTIRLIVSSTEDGLFQTADINDGASVASFGGNAAGDGIVNYSNIFWLNDALDINESGLVTLGDSLNVNGSSDNIFVVNYAGAILPTPNSNTVATFAKNTGVGDSSSVSILSGTFGVSTLELGDAADTDKGRIRYLNAVDQLEFYTNASRAMFLTNSLNAVFEADVTANNGQGQFDSLNILNDSTFNGNVSISTGALDLTNNELLSIGSASQIDSFYEEGSFTPTVLEQGGGGANSYTTREGKFVRVGNQVNIEITLEYDATAMGISPFGQVQISGLPFDVSNYASTSSNPYFFLFRGYATNGTTPRYIHGRIDYATAVNRLDLFLSDSSTILDTSHLGTSTCEMNISGTYITNYYTP